MSELLECPFCGGEADVIDYDDECWVAHQCANGTSVETNSYATESEAIAAWNNRTPIEYDGWFYLPKPKEGIVVYSDPEITRTENGYKVRNSAYVVNEAARKWGEELGEYAMQRICEIWNSRAERTCTIFRVSNTRDIRECSDCGKHIYLDNAYNRSHLNYCPNCGARVVE